MGKPPSEMTRAELLAEYAARGVTLAGAPTIYSLEWRGKLAMKARSQDELTFLRERLAELRTMDDAQ